MEEETEHGPKDWTIRLSVRCFCKYFMAFMACLNFAALGCEAAYRKERKYDFMFFVSEKVIFTIFLLEVLVKLFRGFRLFWTSWWNVWDVVATVTLAVLSSVYPLRHPGVVFLRVLRTFRPLIGEQEMLLDTIKKSVGLVINVLLVILVNMVMFGVLGVLAFGDVAPEYFGDLPSAVYTLFICLMQDDWKAVYAKFQGHDEAYSAALYCIVYILYVGNILMGFITSATYLNCCTGEAHEASSSGGGTPTLTSHDHIAAHVETVFSKASETKCQRPELSSDLGNVNMKTFEKMLLIRQAAYLDMQDNERIIKKLKDAIDVLMRLPQNRKLFEELKQREMRATRLENILANDVASGRVGDWLSTFSILEKEHISDSTTGHLYTTGTFQEGEGTVSGSES